MKQYEQERPPYTQMSLGGRSSSAVSPQGGALPPSGGIGGPDPRACEACERLWNFSPCLCL